MVIYRSILVAILFMLPFIDLSATGTITLEQRIERYINGKDARIGVALIVDGEHAVSVNGQSEFPMLSVYKFPQAIAVAEYCTLNGISFSDSVNIAACELHLDTWSPMRDKYGIKDIKLSLRELLEYSLQQSDNNACDVLFRIIGGPVAVDSLMKATGYAGITIESTEDDMHRDTYLCYLNRSTPVAMAELWEYFYTSLRDKSPLYAEIAEILEHCATGNDRIAASVPLSSLFGHKTGTGDMNSQNRLIGVNDCGYIITPDGRHRYVLAVFIADSAYGLNETAGIIAGIADIILKHG